MTGRFALVDEAVNSPELLPPHPRHGELITPRLCFFIGSDPAWAEGLMRFTQAECYSDCFTAYMHSDKHVCVCERANS